MRKSNPSRRRAMEEDISKKLHPTNEHERTESLNKLRPQHEQRDDSEEEK